MCANPTAYPPSVTSMVPFRQGIDPVRARVTASQQLTNDQMLQAEKAARHPDDVVHRPSAMRGPHPGDVLYWVTCVGGASLILIASTI